MALSKEYNHCCISITEQKINSVLQKAMRVKAQASKYYCLHYLCLHKSAGATAQYIFLKMWR